MNLVPTPVRRLLHALGIDRATAYSLVGQGWALLAQPITLALIALYLTQTELGYVYTFGAIVAVQMYCELGLGVVTLQFASHEAAHLHWAADGTLTGDPAAKARLASLLRQSAYWYMAIAAILSAVLLPGGWVFFTLHGAPGVHWQLPWVWTVLVTTAGLLTIPPLMLLCGCGKMADAARIAGLQRVATNGVQWTALAAGGALLSWPAGQTAGFGFLAGWLATCYGPAIRDLLRHPTTVLPGVDWRREVWPFQWRIAVGGPFSYLTSQIFAPVLFANPAFGPQVAGQMGISLAVMNVLFNTTHAWVGVRVPTFGHLIARREWAALDRLFRRMFVLSTLLAMAGAAGGFAVLVGLQLAGYRLGASMLPPLPLALLLANAVVQHMVLALAAYLRAHKQDPFFGLSVAFGLATAAAVFTVGRAYGATGMAASLLVLNATICLGGGSLVFARCRRAWHADPDTRPVPGSAPGLTV
jgi:hypothetical protein